MLMEGSPLTRLSLRDNRLKLLNFLVSECEAGLIIEAENQAKKLAANSVTFSLNCFVLTIQEMFFKNLFSDF